ncbi:MAG: hypothetical protein D3918_06040 [Candidatus Electrothrix sp. AX2]|nr:hypothetical protein [Candidatus Electrothrix gigas]
MTTIYYKKIIFRAFAPLTRQIRDSRKQLMKILYFRSTISPGTLEIPDRKADRDLKIRYADENAFFNPEYDMHLLPYGMNTFS